MSRRSCSSITTRSAWSRAAEASSQRRSTFAAFRREQADPDTFYSLLARDSVALVARHIQLSGSQVVDVGGGAGYFADAFRARGARCLVVEPDAAELWTDILR